MSPCGGDIVLNAVLNAVLDAVLKFVLSHRDKGYRCDLSLNGAPLKTTYS